MENHSETQDKQKRTRRRVPRDFDFDDRLKDEDDNYIVHFGSIYLNSTGVHVRIHNHKNKFFRYSKFNSKDECYDAALAYRQRKSDEFGLSFLVNKTKRNCPKCDSWFTSKHCPKCVKTDHRFKSCLMKVHFENKQCVDCGENNPLFLENDHVLNNKYKSSTGKTLNVNQVPLCFIREELKKCEQVCIFCHRKRTASRRPQPKMTRNRIFINNLKKRISGCTNCGYSDDEHPFLFDFDHLNSSQKKATIGSLVAGGYSLKILKAELVKTQFLCCKCHLLKTSAEAGYKKLSDFTEDEIARARAFLAE